jgi:hypothetical protein
MTEHERIEYRSVKRQIIPCVRQFTPGGESMVPDGEHITLDKGQLLYLVRLGGSGGFFQVEGAKFYLFRNEYEQFKYSPEVIVTTSDIVVGAEIPARPIPRVS